MISREGLLSSSWRVTETGRRRTYYRLTSKGRKVLEAEMRQ